MGKILTTNNIGNPWTPGITLSDSIVDPVSFNGVCWIKNRFVSMSQDYDKIYHIITSVDGVNWVEEKTMPNTWCTISGYLYKYVNRMKYFSETKTAISYPRPDQYNQRAYAITSNGLDWTWYETIHQNMFDAGVIYAKGVYTTGAYWSTDGISWTATNLQADKICGYDSDDSHTGSQSISYSEQLNMFMVPVCRYNTGGRLDIATSADGKTWTVNEITVGAEATANTDETDYINHSGRFGYSSCWINGKFVMYHRGNSCNINDNWILSSSDGLAWSASPCILNGNTLATTGHGVLYNAYCIKWLNRIAIVGIDTNSIALSSDGINFNSIPILGLNTQSGWSYYRGGFTPNVSPAVLVESEDLGILSIIYSIKANVGYDHAHLSAISPVLYTSTTDPHAETDISIYAPKQYNYTSSSQYYDADVRRWIY